MFFRKAKLKESLKNQEILERARNTSSEDVAGAIVELLREVAKVEARIVREARPAKKQLYIMQGGKK